MVARSYLLSLLAVVATLGSSVFALPQDNEDNAPPVSELAAVPVDVDTPAADARPVPGADSTALLAAAPELERLANAVPNPSVTKRDVRASFVFSSCPYPPQSHLFVHNSTLLAEG
jgi:hypothetical protein